MISDKCPDDMKSEEILGHVYIIYTQSQNEVHGIMGRRFPDGGLLRYRN